METDGTLRGTGKHFFRTPIGAELCGPRFTPDDRALFVWELYTILAIQQLQKARTDTLYLN